MNVACSPGGWTLGLGGPCPRHQVNLQIEPNHAVASVGATVAFTVKPYSEDWSYRWSRCAHNVCTDITGVTGDTYVLNGARLDDDGVWISVTADNCLATGTAASQLEVLSTPGVTYQDSEFMTSDWETVLIHDDTGNARQVVSRLVSGGDPGAFMSVEYEVKGASVALRVFHGALQEAYDPSKAGPVYAINFAAECKGLNVDAFGFLYAPRPAFRQAGRVYQGSVSPKVCDTLIGWQAALDRTSLDSHAFELVAGSPCGPGEACPDFSTAGAPMVFGFVSGADSPPSDTTLHVAYGIDNWRVTVWSK